MNVERAIKILLSYKKDDYVDTELIKAVKVLVEFIHRSAQWPRIS